MGFIHSPGGMSTSSTCHTRILRDLDLELYSKEHWSSPVPEWVNRSKAHTGWNSSDSGSKQLAENNQFWRDQKGWLDSSKGLSEVHLKQTNSLGLTIGFKETSFKGSKIKHFQITWKYYYWPKLSFQNVKKSLTKHAINGTKDIILQIPPSGLKVTQYYWIPYPTPI